MNDILNLLQRSLSEQQTIFINMSDEDDSNQRQYAVECVKAISTRPDCVIATVRQLHKICKSLTKSSAKGNGNADKNVLSELNRKHKIMKIISFSLLQCHQTAVQKAEKSGSILKPETVVNDGYCHSDSVTSHLDLMTFLLKDGGLYLSWYRCNEVWNTLVDNNNAIYFDKNICFKWFRKCLTGMDSQTKHMVFEQKLLKFSPSETSHQSFKCFKAYFECINLDVGYLENNDTSFNVIPNIELIGMSYLWNIIIECRKDNIANEAIEYLLNMSFWHISPKLIKEAMKLHKRFIQTYLATLKTVSNAALPETGSDQGAATHWKRRAAMDTTLSDAETGSSRTGTSISISYSSFLFIIDANKISTLNFQTDILPYSKQETTQHYQKQQMA